MNPSSAICGSRDDGRVTANNTNIFSVCLCACLCLCVYGCARARTRVCVCVCANLCVRTYIHTSVRIYVRTYVRTYVCLHVCMNAYMLTCKHTYVRMYIHATLLTTLLTNVNSYSGYKSTLSSRLFRLMRLISHFNLAQSNVTHLNVVFEFAFKCSRGMFTTPKHLTFQIPTKSIKFRRNYLINYCCYLLHLIYCFYSIA